jgi:putative alpha-1,2-mannosidase
MANEPDINYPFLFNHIKGQEYKTGQKVNELLKKHFKNTPDGLPGNDDTGTMSAWAVFSMMGIYPVSPSEPKYAIFPSIFDKVTIHLNNAYYKNNALILSKESTKEVLKIKVNKEVFDKHFISHDALTN